MAAPTGNGPVIPILGFLTCVAFIYLSFGDLWFGLKTEGELAFVKRNGTQFVVDEHGLLMMEATMLFRSLLVDSMNEFSRP